MSNAENSSVDSKLRQFVKGLKAEWNKIVWPTREKVTKQLIAVLVASVITGVLIVIVDFGAEKLINFLTNL